MKPIRRWLAALLALLCIAAPAIAWGQAAGAQERFAQLLAQTEWPNGRALLATFRAQLPSLFLAGVGRGAKLGAGWGPGNPHWQKAHDAVAAALQAEELRAGPLIPSDAASFARVLISSMPLTDEDFAFLEQLVATPYGRAMVELMDHMAVNEAIQGLITRPGVPAETLREMQALRARIREGVGAVALRLTSAKENQKEEAERFERLMERAGLKRRSGEAAGRELFQRPMERVTSVLLLDTMHAIEGEVRAFRSDAALPKAFD